MPKKPSADILRYLIRLDGFLTQPMKLVVIGGFAIALGWNDQHSTSDIDVIGQLDPELLRAMREAGPEEATVIQSVTVSSQPLNFEDRLQPLVLPQLRYLQILLPEAHDLAVMKMARGLAHDLEGIEGIHKEQSLVLETLVERYHETDYVGRPSTFRLSLLATVSRLFGDAVAEDLAKRPEFLKP